VHAPKDPQELGTLLSHADAVTCETTTELTAAVIDRMTNCKIIATLSIGYDHIDLRAASRKQIYVCCVPNYCVEEVADHTLGLTLGVTRKIYQLNKNLDSRRWEEYQSVGAVHRLRGRTLGLIGVGKIGRAVAERAKAFGLQVIAFDPYLPPNSLSGIRLVPLRELLHEADIISIHSALTHETKGMLSTREFQELKDGVFIVNCARGAIIDTRALVQAIRSGKVAGVGLDVFEKEPPDPDEPLLHMNEVLVTPHTAFLSVEAELDRQRTPIEEIARAWNGEKPRGVVNLNMLETAAQTTE